MICFVDTSAIVAMLDATDKNYLDACEHFRKLRTAKAALICTNYVLLETMAVLQRRIGIQAVRTFEEDIRPAIKVEWVDKGLHEIGVAAVLAASRRDLSIVDCVSFECMRRLGIRHAFAFDAHFQEQGFKLIAE